MTRSILALVLLGAGTAPGLILDETLIRLVADGLASPVSLSAPGDGSGRLFVSEKAGRVRILEDGVALEEPFLDLRTLIDSRGVEQGLLDVAFPPDYAASGRFYVSYTNNGGDLTLARYRVSADPRRADPASGAVLLVVPQPTKIHQSGQLAFGPDGYLYVGSGDGGDNLQGPDVARDRATLLGKILRLDVSGDGGYAVPADNPFVGVAGAREEVYASGLRNPWRFSFDRATGDLFIADVGHQREEEVNWIPAGSGGGQDFGWRTMEGARCFESAGGCLNPELTLPLLRYPHDAVICRAVIGGYAYRGRLGLEAEGRYVFGDFCTGQVFLAAAQFGAWRIVETRQTELKLTSFGQDDDGELYAVDFAGGAVYRFDFPRPAPRVTALEPPETSRGRPALTLTVVGEGFTPESEVRWRGRPVPTTYVDRRRLEARIAAAELAATGNRQVAVANPEPGGGLSDAMIFRIAAEPQPPEISSGGVLNAAGFGVERPLAPGAIAAVFGEALARGTARAAGYPLPSELAGTRATLDGTLPAPLFFVSWEQANLLIPWEAPGQGEALLRFETDGLAGPPYRLRLAPFSPGVFTLDSGGQAAALIAGSDGVIAAPRGFGARPVRRGETLEIYAAGLGAVAFPPASGEAAGADPLSTTLTPVDVRLGGIVVEPRFAGLAPGFAGLYQVNVTVPPSAASGERVGLALVVGGIESDAAFVAVE